jgi:importin subunit alpha-1
LHCLKILGNIVSGNPLQTQAVIESGILKYLSQLIFHEKRSIRKETCWVISNIAAGTQQQIKALIVNDFLLILDRVIKTDEPEVKYFYFNLKS